jgi:hypothetical protein
MEIGRAQKIAYHLAVAFGDEGPFRLIVQVRIGDQVGEQFPVPVDGIDGASQETGLAADPADGLPVAFLVPADKYLPRRMRPPAGDIIFLQNKQMARELLFCLDEAHSPPPNMGPPSFRYIPLETFITAECLASTMVWASQRPR